MRTGAVPFLPGRQQREELLVEARVGHEVGVDEQHPVGPAVVDGDVAQSVDGVQAAGMEVGEDQVEVDALAEGRYGCEIRGQVPAVQGYRPWPTPSLHHLQSMKSQTHSIKISRFTVSRLRENVQAIRCQLRDPRYIDLLELDLRCKKGMNKDLTQPHTDTRQPSSNSNQKE
jgi:hypothetical protein